MENNDRVIKAGNIQLHYNNASLRRITLPGREMLRMITFALRDEDWRTIPLKIINESFKCNEDHFAIEIHASNTWLDQEVLDWICTISGSKQQEIVFEIRGVFLKDFKSNRAGFCVLHPIKESIGQPFEIGHPDGHTTTGRFPKYISPDQVAMNISKFNWTTKDEIVAEMQFEGEVFEMEDQRNWTDASFKTYCTPLALPFPVQRKKGDKIWQKVLFKTNTLVIEPQVETGVKINFDLNEKFPLPSLGTCLPIDRDQRLPSTKFQLNSLLSVLRVDILWGSVDWQSEMEEIVAFAKMQNVKIHPVLHYTEGDMLLLVQDLGNLIEKDMLFSISILQWQRVTPEATFLQNATTVLRQYFSGIKIGTGTKNYFTQLNRNRPPVDNVDFVFYSANPQVHAFDNLTLVENIEGMSATAESCRAIYSTKPIFMSPLTLVPRFNPDATSVAEYEKLKYDYPSDKRQKEEFLSAWTLGCISVLARERIQHIDLYELFGSRGFFSGYKPDPVFHFLLRIYGKNNITLFETESLAPLQFCSLGIQCEEGTFILLGNLTNDSIQIEKEGLEGFQLTWSNKKNRIPSSSAKEARRFDRHIALTSFECIELLLEK